jgi:hypothetical protein
VQLVVFLTDSVVFPARSWTWIIFTAKALTYIGYSHGRVITSIFWNETIRTRRPLDVVAAVRE